jgi:hypothetical protein
MAKVTSSLDGDEFCAGRGWHSIACGASHLAARRSRYAARTLVNLDGVSMMDKSMQGSYQINLPKDLLSEARKQPKPKKEHLKVEGWRSSWLTRVSEMLVGKD